MYHFLLLLEVCIPLILHVYVCVCAQRSINICKYLVWESSVLILTE